MKNTTLEGWRRELATTNLGSVKGPRCTETLASGQRCRLHSGHDGAHQYMSSADWRRLQIERADPKGFKVSVAHIQPVDDPRGELESRRGGEGTTLELHGLSIVNAPPDDESPAAMAERLRLEALRRARRTIVLEIDCLKADNEADRARNLQAALDAIDHFVMQLITHSRAFQ